MTPELQRELTVRADAAVRYKTELGWSIIPTHGARDGICTCPMGARCTRAGKHPARTNFLEMVHDDAATLRSRWTLVCFNMARVVDDLVVDVDGARALALLQKFGPWPVTPTVITARGFQMHLRWPFGTPTPTVGGLDKLPCDIRGVRDLATLPPSVHKTGHRYHWRDGESPFDIPVALAPLAFAKFVERIANARAKKRAPDANVTSMAGAMQLATRRASYASHSSNGAGRGAVGLRRTLDEAGASAEVIDAAVSQFTAEAGR